MEWDLKFSMDVILESYVNACKDCDLILGTQSTNDETYAVAEKYGIAWGLMLLGPYLPSSEYPALFAEDIIIFSWMYMFSHTFMGKMSWRYKEKIINPWREKVLGIPPINESMGTVSLWLKHNRMIFNAFSPLILPKKKAPKDYGSHTHTLGFVFVAETPEEKIGHDIKKFIAEDPWVHEGKVSKPRPIAYIGFGSMAGFDFFQFILEIKKVISVVKCRVVLISGWSTVDGDKCKAELAELVAERTLIILTGCPHDWLFPKMNCIIHHCGVTIV